MPIIVIILGIVPSLLDLTKVIIVKFVPSHITKNRKFHGKQKITDGLDRFKGKTLEQIAKMGGR